MKRNFVGLFILCVLLLAIVPVASAQTGDVPVLTVVYSDGGTTVSEGAIAGGGAFHFYATYAGAVQSASVALPDGTTVAWNQVNGAQFADPCNGGEATWHWVMGPSQVLTISGAECTPLAVTVEDFGVVCNGATVAMATWTTTSELEISGFNLVRSEDEQSTNVLLWFIPAQGPGSSQGYEYQHVTGVEPGQQYWYSLVLLDLAGQPSEQIGPIVITCGQPTAVRLSALTASTGQGSGASVATLCAAVFVVLIALAFVLSRHGRRRAKS